MPAAGRQGVGVLRVVVDRQPRPDPALVRRGRVGHPDVQDAGGTSPRMVTAADPSIRMFVPLPTCDRVPPQAADDQVVAVAGRDRVVAVALDHDVAAVPSRMDVVAVAQRARYCSRRRPRPLSLPLPSVTVLFPPPSWMVSLPSPAVTVAGRVRVDASVKVSLPA